ncbi:uncharacterized protein LOC124810514 isoform X2 [Hydra vulgaris]|uniref:uncharacterized protein LOC124810514 isoform X2 n=1 Tax=Hydra vulgaris TaxID=6087 RepID=UPI001F5F2FE2|nr:uncharacterized protein LOC124810514 isoform X2 [Hydra vulgaris]
MLDQSFHSMMMKKICSCDSKLREFLIGLINDKASFAVTSKSYCNNNSSTNIFDEVENKWKAIISESFTLQIAPILVQGSSTEGGSSARLANPTLKTIIEFEIDLNIIIGTVSQMQFKTCYETLDKNKAFFHYVIKNDFANDINICIHIPEKFEKKISCFCL